MNTMRTLSDSIKRDLRKDPEALEHEAGEVRADVERTLQDLERRLSPSALLDRGLLAVKENGGDFGRNLAVQVRNNPLPALLAGIALTWLMAASDRPPHAFGEPQRRSRTGSSSRHAARVTAEAGARVRHGARTAAQGAGDAGRAVRRGYRYMRREQPLMLRALAVAAGAAIGALLPTGTASQDQNREVAIDRELRRRTKALREEKRRIMAGTAPKQLVEPSMSEQITAASGSTFSDARSVSQP